MEILKFIFDNVLGPVFGNDLELIEGPLQSKNTDNDDDDDDDGAEDEVELGQSGKESDKDDVRSVPGNDYGSETVDFYRRNRARARSSLRAASETNIGAFNRSNSVKSRHSFRNWRRLSQGSLASPQLRSRSINRARCRPIRSPEATNNSLYYRRRHRLVKSPAIKCTRTISDIDATIDLTSAAPAAAINADTDTGSSASSSWWWWSSEIGLGDAQLDSSGPKLIDGVRNWLLYLVIIGQLNIPSVPLYVSLLYKLFALTLSSYILCTKFVISLFATNILESNRSSNPVFVFMGGLSIVVSFLTVLVLFYTNLLKLSPLFKILTTPELCFIKRQSQQVMGSKSLKYVLVFNAYHTLLCHLMTNHGFNHLFSSFRLFEFLLEYYAVNVFVYNIVGLAHLDLYIRFSFASWLLALKCNLEYRLIRYNYMRTKLALRAAKGRDRRRDGSSASSACRQPLRPQSFSPKHNRRGQLHQEHRSRHKARPVLELFKETYKFVSLDEVQKSLNTMDDHLEVWRSVQTYPLVLVCLNSFLTNGTLLMISYNLLAKENDYFHGLTSVLLSLNYAIIIITTYMGDSFIYYSLSSFVQTVEDEYFVQEFSAPSGGQARSKPGGSSATPPPNADHTDGGADVDVGGGGGLSGESAGHTRRVDSLAIKMNDVLFCRELLHQFENHLATPWSKLTFKSHLNMMATFATLIAAQIIFDRE